jgi:hypothetical protein
MTPEATRFSRPFAVGKCASVVTTSASKKGKAQSALFEWAMHRNVRAIEALIAANFAAPPEFPQDFEKIGDF